MSGNHTPSVQPDQVATALNVSIGLLVRRLRVLMADGELSQPELAAMARLDRNGPATVTELARAEQISSQSIGSTLSALEGRSLVERRSDLHDGRRSIMSVTDAGRHLLRNQRDARTAHITAALSEGFTNVELRRLLAAAPLIERMALQL